VAALIVPTRSLTSVSRSTDVVHPVLDTTTFKNTEKCRCLVAPHARPRLPFETIWFGAARGCLISARRIFEHCKWRPSLDYWHYARNRPGGADRNARGCIVFVVLSDAR
jgi:hypothetical protein